MQRPVRAGEPCAGLVFIYMVHGTHATSKSGKNKLSLVVKHHPCFLSEGALESSGSRAEDSEVLKSWVALTKIVGEQGRKALHKGFG